MTEEHAALTRVAAGINGWWRAAPRVSAVAAGQRHRRHRHTLRQTPRGRYQGHEAVSRARRGERPQAGGVPHVYGTGASLYSTVVASQAEEPLAQWENAKTAASAAISDSRATITHHHAVGRVHVPWLEQEIGPVGVEILRAIKGRIDPNGILNPGVLLP